MRRKHLGGQAAEIAAMKKVMPVLAHISQTGGRRRRKHRGAGFFSSLWDGIKSVASAAAPAINDALKSTKIISSGLSMVPGVGGILSKGASSLGYGRRKKVVRKYKGGLMAMSVKPAMHSQAGGRRRRRK